MTAPAVLRHWNDPRASRVGSRIGESAGSRLAADGRARIGASVRAAVLGEARWLRRVAPLGAGLLTALVAHVGIAPHLAVRGSAADVLLVSVVAVAAARGSRVGAGYGFAAGLGADVFLATPLGTAALVYTLVGHGLGRSGRRRIPGRSAAALCRPDSPCFACRTGPLRPDRPHPAGLRGLRSDHAELAGLARVPDRECLSQSRSTVTIPVPRNGEADSAMLNGETGPLAGRRPSRARRRAAARRAELRRTVVVTFIGVGAGHLGTAVVATTLAGVPFLDTSGLLRIAGVAALSAPFGPLTTAIVRRAGRGGGGAG